MCICFEVKTLNEKPTLSGEIHVPYPSNVERKEKGDTGMRGGSPQLRLRYTINYLRVNS